MQTFFHRDKIIKCLLLFGINPEPQNMSLRTKIRGFTAWINLRLMPYDQLLNNVLMDLLTGTNMKLLLESMTGRPMRRLDTMDGYLINYHIFYSEKVK